MNLDKTHALEAVRARIARYASGDASVVGALIADLRHFLGRDRLQRAQISAMRDALIRIERLGGPAGDIARGVLFVRMRMLQEGGAVHKGPGAKSVGEAF